MRQCALGSATVTAIGCGDVWLKGSAARGLDGRDVERSLHEALDLGLSLVDVHDEEDAERLVADAVRALRVRDRVTTALRIPLVPELPAGPPRDGLVDRLPAKYLVERVERTLRATRSDVLPLVQLPLRAAWRTSKAWAELAGTCERLVREGKVLQWGALLDDPEATDLVAEPWLAAIAIRYSLCDRALEPLIAAAVTHKRTVLARAPLGGGALTGRLGPGVKLAIHDDRRALSPKALERISVIAATLAPLVSHEPPAARASEPAKEALDRGTRPAHVEASTVAELALRFVIDRDVIALPRLHRREHLGEAVLAASAPPLTPGLVQRLLDADLAVSG